MLICTYVDGGRRGHGRVEGERVVPVEYDQGGRRWVERPGLARSIGEIRLLPPAEPSKIACLALNYPPASGPAAGNAVVLKPPSLAAPDDPVVHPEGPWELRHEAELAVVIGMRCRRVRAGDAADVVAGYTCANDITAYAPFPVLWAKHFDGLTPLGPWLATDLDPDNVEITCTVDGVTRQRGSTRDLLKSVHEVIASVSEHTTLLPGDVILTGTPAGSGPLHPGDLVEVSITGIGTLRNTVASGRAMAGSGASGGGQPRDATH
jgi:2-keto-4-pentenoate hydratase/2-oxohepta-3-ene-1,7-dioic acid hydratase in catechol pathway